MFTDKKTIKKRYPNKLLYNKEIRSYEVDGYTLEGVTSWIEKYKKPFDRFVISNAVSKANKTKGLNESTPEKVMHIWDLKWKLSEVKGRALHLFAELYELIPTECYAETPNEKAVISYLNFVKDKYTLIGTEVRLYSKLYGLMGIADRIVEDKSDGKWIIQDWKSTKDIDKNNGNMLDDFKDYKQNKRVETAIQLFVYGQMDMYESKKDNYVKFPKDKIKSFQMIKILGDSFSIIELTDNDIKIDIVKQALEKRADYSRII